MNLEEYQKQAEEQDDWAPGWDAIEESFEKLYPNQEPKHFGTNMAARAMFGGEAYLDGYSIYTSENGYKHIVTFGMTELYTNEEAFGGEFSQWGYEMTMKLPVETEEDCMWAINMLSNLARYTFTQKRFFEPLQYVAGNGNSINKDVESSIAALLIVEDTEVEGKDTVHGRVDFLQLVGITQQELEKIMEDVDQAKVLMERMKKDNPYLVTDLSRTESYL